MSHLKPIEPGCLALTYGCFVPENNGKVVTVIRFVGRHPTDRLYLTEDLWETDGLFVAIGTNTKKVKYIDGYINESKLMRIDGYEDDKKLTEIAKELS